MIAGTQSAPRLFSRRICWALFWQLARIALKPITRDRTANAQVNFATVFQKGD